jgi:catechol 2,3-dioxygenase-like lactoylglutathione lyase family enzyme
MAISDVTIPTLPARDLDETIAFCGVLGFKAVFRHPDPEGYAIVRRDALEIHFFRWPALDPALNYAGCYMRVSDVDALYEAFSAARLPARGIPSLGGIEKKFFNMREFRLVDPNGNLLRVGEELKVPAARRG